jgi:hypothetical protein
VLGLPLVLVLPGYALVEAFGPTSLSRSVRTLLSLGLSLAVTAVSGLVLDQLWALDRTAWSTFLGLITIGGCILAAGGREGRPVPLTVPDLAALRGRLRVLLPRVGLRRLAPRHLSWFESRAALLSPHTGSMLAAAGTRLRPRRRLDARRREGASRPAVVASSGA